MPETEEHKHIVYVPGTDPKRVLLRWTDDSSARINGHKYGPADCEDPECPVVMKKIQQRLRGADYVRMPMKELVDHPDFDSHVARTMFKIMNLPNDEIVKIDVSKLKEC